MKKLKIINVYIALALVPILIITSCKKKEEFLDAKPVSSLTVPTTPSDFQSLLDNTQLTDANVLLGETSADDYYVKTPAAWSAIANVADRNAYVWSEDIYQGQTQGSWNNAYKQVFAANIVLEGLEKVIAAGASSEQFNEMKGQALFLRSFAFFNLAQVFAVPYDVNTANTDLGIPLKLTADVNDVTGRGTLQQTYNQIIADLKTAIPLLPAGIPMNNRNRSSRPSAYALLARTYLSMRDYVNAGLAARSSLSLYNVLVDYNSFTAPTGSNFIKVDFAETMYNASLATGVGTNIFYISLGSNYSVDTTLLRSYATNDLRFKVFYSTAGRPKVSYSGTYYNGFAGLATDETYLISAECYARAGNTAAALADLNTLLIKRWVSGKFVPYTAQTSDAALALILQERRKELVIRGLRWMDLRRLNKEGYNITLTRKLGTLTYTLPANSPRFTLPIPPDELAINPIQQNPR